MASVVSVLTGVRAALGFETASVVDRELRIWSEASRRGRHRPRVSNRDAFFDVQYESLVRDPVATIREIYRWLDLELTDVVATAMTKWLEENPSHKHGEHEYDAARLRHHAGADRAVLRPKSRA